MRKQAPAADIASDASVGSQAFNLPTGSGEQQSELILTAVTATDLRHQISQQEKSAFWRFRRELCISLAQQSVRTGLA